MNVTQWHGCYSGSWNGILVPDAFAHPAKFAPMLIYRILRHMLERGYIQPGDSLLDPFGGIGSGGYYAMLLGLHWTGVELEPRFVELGQRNFDKWRRDLAMLNGTLGTARLLQGDSRRLLEVVGGGMGAAVSSPPFEDGLPQLDRNFIAPHDSTRNLQNAIYGSTPGQLGSMPSGSYAAAVGSPPYDVKTVHSDSRAQERCNEKGGELGRWGMHTNGVAAQGDYGLTPGQLGSMRSGDYAAAVSSPPFGEQQSGGGIGAALQGKGDYEITTSRPAANAGYANQADSPGNLAALRADDAGFSAAVSSPPYADNAATWVEGPGARHDPIHHNGDNAHKVSSANGYGATPGNVGHMRDAGFEAAVSSPPYEHSLESRGDGIDWDKTTAVHRGHRSAGRGAIADGYGHEPGNIGADTGDTFWAASRVILAQTYMVLKPGGYAVWVTKDFVRKGQRVPFSDQWQQLCEAVGFEPVERIYAMLVEDHGEQLDIFGGATARRKERKSFFRRLAEKKGSPRIDHEDVIVMRKPLFRANGHGHGATE